MKKNRHSVKYSVSDDTFPEAVAVYGKATIMYTEELVLRELDQRASRIEIFIYNKTIKV